MRRCVALSLIALVSPACAGKEFPPIPAHLHIPEPPLDSVQNVLFLIGDAGRATLSTSPTLQHLRAEVDRWSLGIGRDSGVFVLYLGDNVYPVGLRDEADRAFPTDSTILQGQIDVVAGENARRYKARALFIAGNHDWGHKPGDVGRTRLDNQDRFITRRSKAQSIEADLIPRASDPAPGVVDIGRSVRLLLIDTSWWLLEADRNEKARVTQIVERYMAGAQGRSIVLAAHHPWTSGSAHGGLVPFWGTIGVKWLLSRAGAALQDINSLPYRDLKDQLTGIFQRTSPPLLWAGGHDHALQVIKGIQTNEPRYLIVSGSGSKLSKVGDTAGMLFRRSEPGFMRVVIMKNGSIDVFVVSGPAEYLECVGSQAVVAQCMEAGPREFKTVFSVRLKE